MPDNDTLRAQIAAREKRKAKTDAETKRRKEYEKNNPSSTLPKSAEPKKKTKEEIDADMARKMENDKRILAGIDRDIVSDEEIKDKDIGAAFDEIMGDNDNAEYDEVLTALVDKGFDKTEAEAFLAEFVTGEQEDTHEADMARADSLGSDLDAALAAMSKTPQQHLIDILKEMKYG